jgi:hypothetical protein
VISLVLWLWRDEANRHNRVSPYSVDKVERAARMIRGSMTDPHEIVVITDQPAHEFSSELRVVPMWKDLSHMGRCWRRLKAFDPSMRELFGPRFCWIDLDMVVLGDITPLFQRKEDIVFWKPGTTRTPYNGSMVMMTAGARGDVWKKFSAQRAKVAINQMGYPGTDQAWWSCYLGPNEASWTPERDGVCAYWQNCRPSPPTNARIVYFPGSLKDNGSYVRNHSPWVKQALDRAMALEEEQYQWKRTSPPTRFRGRTKPNLKPVRLVVPEGEIR